ncbi:hypothetical protein CVT24_001302 [Panaeolus cyanescens]|uniref:Uncharacterized protein n=1 Tax=Panaeolus cyanescens TaxID=181874 RepID=A0A409YG30_9AGAR|nr:hypothetical protein CVT24_001302 [Panaeolus cyanescens]
MDSSKGDKSPPSSPRHNQSHDIRRLLTTTRSKLHDREKTVQKENQDRENIRPSGSPLGGSPSDQHEQQMLCMMRERDFPPETSDGGNIPISGSNLESLLTRKRRRREIVRRIDEIDAALSLSSMSRGGTTFRLPETLDEGFILPSGSTLGVQNVQTPLHRHGLASSPIIRSQNFNGVMVPQRTIDGRYSAPFASGSGLRSPNPPSLHAPANTPTIDYSGTTQIETEGGQTRKRQRHRRRPRNDPVPAPLGAPPTTHYQLGIRDTGNEIMPETLYSLNILPSGRTRRPAPADYHPTMTTCQVGTMAGNEIRTHNPVPVVPLSKHFLDIANTPRVSPSPSRDEDRSTSDYRFHPYRTPSVVSSLGRSSVGLPYRRFPNSYTPRGHLKAATDLGFWRRDDKHILINFAKKFRKHPKDAFKQRELDCVFSKSGPLELANKQNELGILLELPSVHTITIRHLEDKRPKSYNESYPSRPDRYSKAVIIRSYLFPKGRISTLNTLVLHAYAGVPLVLILSSPQLLTLQLDKCTIPRVTMPSDKEVQEGFNLTKYISTGTRGNSRELLDLCTQLNRDNPKSFNIDGFSTYQESPIQAHISELDTTFTDIDNVAGPSGTA